MGVHERGPPLRSCERLKVLYVMTNIRYHAIRLCLYAPLFVSFRVVRPVAARVSGCWLPRVFFFPYLHVWCGIAECSPLRFVLLVLPFSARASYIYLLVGCPGSSHTLLCGILPSHGNVSFDVSAPTVSGVAACASHCLPSI